MSSIKEATKSSPEPPRIDANRGVSDRGLGRAADLVLEVGVDYPSFAGLDQLDQVAQLHPDNLKHPRRDVLPKLVRLDLKDERQLLADRRDVCEGLEIGGNAADLAL